MHTNLSTKKNAQTFLRLLVILSLALTLKSCGNNHHLGEQASLSAPTNAVVDLVIPASIASGASVVLAGSCSPSGNITISSPTMVPSSVSCLCTAGSITGCGSVTFDGSDPSPTLTTTINADGTVSTDSDSLTINSGSFDCPASSTYMATGIFTTNASSTGTLTIPIKDAAPGTVQVQFSSNGFTANESVSLLGGETSITLNNLGFDGTASGGYVTFTLAGTGLSGSCTGEAIVLNVADQLFGFSGGEYIEDGTNGICAYTSDNRVWCWGTNDDLHNGSTVPGTLNEINGFTDTPKRILPLEANSFLITDQGTLEGFGIQSSATSKALGRNGVNGYNPPGAVSGWPATNTVRNIKGDHSEACAVLDNNDLWCWGKNDEGELGDGTGSTRLTPVGPVASNVKKMYLGGDVHCYLDQSNQAYCVGEGSDGELGNGTNASSNTYGPVTGLSDAVDMAVIGRGDTETICAIRLDQTVWCWGLNTYGQVGDATTTSRNTPTQVSGLTDAIKLTGGRSHFCALKSDGTVWCWGRNDQGQLGDGTKVNKSVPVQVQDSSGAIGLVSAIGTGEKHNCVLKTDGSVWCWGDNPNGQLGDATTTDKTTAINYGLGANPAAIGIKVYFDDTCMVTAAGDAYCSGRHSGSNATSIFISF